MIHAAISVAAGVVGEMAVGEVAVDDLHRHIRAELRRPAAGHIRSVDSQLDRARVSRGQQVGLEDHAADELVVRVLRVQVDRRDAVELLSLGRFKRYEGGLRPRLLAPR